jgi:hypothetical protein
VGPAPSRALYDGANRSRRTSSVLILADETYKWFYWIGFALVLGMLALFAAIALGYYVRVLRPKWRGQKQQ